MYIFYESIRIASAVIEQHVSQAHQKQLTLDGLELFTVMIDSLQGYYKNSSSFELVGSWSDLREIDNLCYDWWIHSKTANRWIGFTISVIPGKYPNDISENTPLIHTAQLWSLIKAAQAANTLPLIMYFNPFDSTENWRIVPPVELLRLLDDTDSDSILGPTLSGSAPMLEFSEPDMLDAYEWPITDLLWQMYLVYGGFDLFPVPVGADLLPGQGQFPELPETFTASRRMIQYVEDGSAVVWKDI